MNGRREYLWGPGREGDATRFRLWSPSRSDISLEVDGARIAMLPAGDGWYEAKAHAGVGTRYRFFIGDVPVPDPASRVQTGDGYSLIADAVAYRWRDDTWRGRPWDEAIIYEAHAGLLGGFDGVRRHLPRLADLGVTAVELMPIGEFPGARNWGYDGVLPYAPEASYGTPDELKRLVDEAHGLGLMLFLDVVYNHFGPDGNYLPLYARDFFRGDRHTPWGDAIDFRVEAVRRFFIDNALYWLDEFHIDGLRFDAVHAIRDDEFLEALARDIRAAIPAGRHVHLIVENENNDARLLEHGFDAQWNDDFHHALHVLLTGETSGYYADYGDRPIEKLARSLREGFVYQGEMSPHSGRPRGTRSGALPTTAFVNFLQNHDHIGNRAFGERLLSIADADAVKGAATLLILSPFIPLLFMGEEAGATEPFLYFCDHRDAKLAQAVRDGRRAEFAKFPEFADEAKRATIPDPNAPETFARSRPSFEGQSAAEWNALYRGLLALRRQHIAPRLKGARAEFAEAIGERAVIARWRMGDGARLTVAANFSGGPIPADLPKGMPIWGEVSPAVGPRTTVVWVEAP